MKNRNSKELINLIVRVALVGSLAIILYCVPMLQFPIIPGISFLKLHFDEIPCLIASLAYGPLTGSCIVLLKGLFKLITDLGETGGVGTLIDIIYGLSLIIPAGLIYKKHNSFKGLIVSISIGALSSIIMSSFIGYYAFFPLYGLFFNPDCKSYYDTLNTILPLFNVVDKSITNPYDIRICLEFLLPFNVIKNLITCIITFISFKPLLKLLK